MRTFEVLLYPADENVHPLGRVLQTYPDASPRYLTQVNFFGDGTAGAVVTVEGDVAGMRDAVAALSETLECQLVAEGGGEGSIYVHARTNEVVRAVQEITEQFHLLVDTPCRFSAEGYLEVRLVGTEANIREAMAAIPRGDVRYEVRKATRFVPDPSEAVLDLTERQQQIMRRAIEDGYYASPRETTVRDIAADLSISPPTVSEHLQKAESTVIKNCF